MIHFEVRGQALSVFLPPATTSDTLAYLSASFDFNSKWDGLNKWLHLRDENGQTYDIEIVNDTIVPGGLNLSAGRWEAWIHGTEMPTDRTGDGPTMRIVTANVSFDVDASGMMSFGPLPPIETTAAEQIAANARYARDQVDALRREWEKLKPGINSISTEAKSWAVGGTGSREGEDTDNSKYYAEQAREYGRTVTVTFTGPLSGELSSDKTYAEAVEALSRGAVLEAKYGNAILHISGKGRILVFVAIPYVDSGVDKGLVIRMGSDGAYGSEFDIGGSSGPLEELTFTGAAKGTYDGTKPLTVHIPDGSSAGGALYVTFEKTGDKEVSYDVPFKEIHAAMEANTPVYGIYDGYVLRATTWGPIHVYFTCYPGYEGDDGWNYGQSIIVMDDETNIGELTLAKIGKSEVFTATITDEVGRQVCDMTSAEIIDAERKGIVRAVYTDSVSHETRTYYFAKQMPDGRAVFSKDGYIEDGVPKQALIYVDYAGNVKTEIRDGTDGEDLVERYTCTDAADEAEKVQIVKTKAVPPALKDIFIVSFTEGNTASTMNLHFGSAVYAVTGDLAMSPGYEAQFYVTKHDPTGLSNEVILLNPDSSVPIRELNESLGYVTPEMFGAAGDGVADDTTAIQAGCDAAIKAGLTLRAWGKYKSNKITIDTARDLSLDFTGATITIDTAGIYLLEVKKIGRLFITGGHFTTDLIPNAVYVIHQGECKSFEADGCTYEKMTGFFKTDYYADRSPKHQLTANNVILRNIRGYDVTIFADLNNVHGCSCNNIRIGGTAIKPREFFYTVANCRNLVMQNIVMTDIQRFFIHSNRTTGSDYHPQNGVLTSAGWIFRNICLAFDPEWVSGQAIIDASGDNADILIDGLEVVGNRSLIYGADAGKIDRVDIRNFRIMNSDKSGNEYDFSNTHKNTVGHFALKNGEFHGTIGTFIVKVQTDEFWIESVTFRNPWDTITPGNLIGFSVPCPSFRFCECKILQTNIGVQRHVLFCSEGGVNALIANNYVDSQTPINRFGLFLGPSAGNVVMHDNAAIGAMKGIFCDNQQAGGQSVQYNNYRNFEPK